MNLSCLVVVGCWTDHVRRRLIDEELLPALRTQMFAGLNCGNLPLIIPDDKVSQDLRDDG